MTPATLTRPDPLSSARAAQSNAAQAEVLDVCIVGGGVNGAAVFRELADQGTRTLLVERGDFCSATSQASGLLIWGGLLYLRNLEFRTVHKLCAERDQLLANDPANVLPMAFRYMPLKGTARRRWFVNLALKLYWLLGGRRRAWPHGQARFPAQDLVAEGRFKSSLWYEEAGVVDSDCHYVSSWITSRMGAQQQALNHCSLESARWDAGSKLWVIELEDKLTGQRSQARARVLINAAGVWVDELNSRFGLTSPYRHVLSKGVYINLPRPRALQETLVFETELNGDNMTFTPWGPVALWGPTEGLVDSIQEGYAPNAEDLRFLLDQAGNNLRPRPTAEDVVSLRCGIRPLAVKRSYSSDRYPLSISRRHLVVPSKRLPALSIYGGKITSAPMLAREVARELTAFDLPGRQPAAHQGPTGPAPTRAYPGLEQPQADPLWCRDQEACVTLQDYLRRRSNVAQWLPRMGLGRNDQHRDHLLQLAALFHGDEGAAAAVQDLQRLADRQDALLASV